MGFAQVLHLGLVIFNCFTISLVVADDRYLFFTWTVTYGTAEPLGARQRVILINGQFPGPRIDCITNDNIIINAINKLDQPFLITWNGIKQRKNSWQDGVLGTNCPIPPNSNYTYKFQAKDQIGTFTYFPSTLLQRAAGGFGALNINQRSVISIPYPAPAGDFTLLVGDWYRSSHKVLQGNLNFGKHLPFPDGLLINGQSRPSYFWGNKDSRYKFRISNVGLSTSINFRIQGHKLQLIEVEGSHTIQTFYDSLDVHVGQSMTVMVTLDQPVKDYYIVVSTRFTRKVLSAIAVLQYSNSKVRASGPLPPAPSSLLWSLKQARTIRLNLTANAARPNPQGSFHYGLIKPTRSLILANSAPMINGKQRYTVNSVSYVNPRTPLKLADYYNIPNVFNFNTIQVTPSNRSAFLGTSVISATLHDFYEIVFQNTENSMQTWHLDGYSFWVVGIGRGSWTTKRRRVYNLLDAVYRHTVQVYPNGWTAVLVSLDNKGMWNLRSAAWARQYLGQQLYIRVSNSENSLSTEYNIPSNALLCGKAVRHS